jgi:hypothetical protein
MIKIIRLQDGLDIICEHTHMSGINVVKNPMVVFLDYEEDEPELVMQHWIPIDIVKQNETTISDANVLCIFDPSETLAEFYQNNIESLIMDTKNYDTEQTSIEEVIAAFDTAKLGKKKLH